MPIPYACSCGKQIRIPDDYAGKRIKCPGCGEGLTVPSADSGKAESAAGSLVRFSCSCGKQLQARAEHAGRLTRCPECGEKQEIPDPEEVQRQEARSRIQSEPPRGKKSLARVSRDEDEEEDRPRRRKRDEDDEDPDEDDAPRKSKRDEDDEDPDRERLRKRGKKKKKEKKGGLVLIIVGVAALVLVLGGGVFAAVWFLRGGGGQGEMAFIPPDAQGFVTIRTAEVQRADLFQKAVKAQGKDPIPEMASELGLQTNDLERLTFVLQDGNQNVMWAILATSKAYDRKAILARLNNAREVPHEGKTFHVGSTSSAAPAPGMMPPGAGRPGMMPQPRAKQLVLYFAGPRVLVFAPDENAMKRCLDAAARKNVTGPLADSIRQVGGSRHLFGAFNLPASAQQQMRAGLGMLGPQAKGAAPVMEVTGGTVGVDFGSTMSVDVSLKYADEPKAKDAKKGIDGLLALAALFMPEGQDKQANAAAKQALESVKVDQRGSEVTIKMQVASQAVDAITNQAMRPGVPKGPGPRPRK